MTIPTIRAKDCDGLLKTETTVDDKKVHVIDADYSCLNCVGNLTDTTQIQYRHNRFEDNEIQVLGTVGAWKISTPNGRRYVARTDDETTGAQW